MPVGLRHGRRVCIPAAIAALLAFSGCKVISIEEDRAAREQRSESFDADRYVRNEWKPRVLPQLEKSAIPLPQLMAAISEGLEAAGTKFGRKVGEGSPWTFVVEGKGIVRSINDQSLEGTIEVGIPGAGGYPSLLIQTGPVIVDNSLRDALPFLSFNDFANQIAFADVGRHLTSRALADTKSALQNLQVGDEVAFLGTFNLTASDDPPRLIPVRIAEPGRES